MGTLRKTMNKSAVPGMYYKDEFHGHFALRFSAETALAEGGRRRIAGVALRAGERNHRIVRRVQDPFADGEEIIQDVFLSLYRHLQLGRSRKNLRGWLFRVVHNLSLKRRCAVHRVLKTLHSDCSLMEKQIDLAPNPEERLAEAQRHDRLRAVLQALPERDQSCLHLRAEGLRYREIADVLGMSLGAVSISLTRSLARLERADEK
jgi:RNA polymerase sigma factor (sigma-70 family)